MVNKVYDSFYLSKVYYAAYFEYIEMYHKSCLGYSNVTLESIELDK